MYENLRIRIYEDTFGNEEFPFDLEEQVGYRTPFKDHDKELVEILFNNMVKSYIWSNSLLDWKKK